jgi:hypothetical protein
LLRVSGDFDFVTMVMSHLVIGDEMVIFFTDVSPLCDELDVIMEMNTICDYRFWSWISGLSGVVDG